jgi:hypothetical protein
MPNDSQLLTAIAQTPIIKSWIKLTDYVTNSPLTYAWTAISTFYFKDLPPDCQPDCKTLYEEITTELRKIDTTQVKDKLFRDTEIDALLKQYLAQKIPLMLQQMKITLYVKKYMKLDFSITPAYERSKL